LRHIVNVFASLSTTLKPARSCRRTAGLSFSTLRLSASNPSLRARSASAQERHSDAASARVFSNGDRDFRNLFVDEAEAGLGGGKEPIPGGADRRAAVVFRDRYEWSDNRVVGTTQDSNVFRPDGTWTLTVEPRDGAGSHIRVVFDRRFKGKGWLFYPAVALFGPRMFKRNLQKTLNVVAHGAS
jgi:hypothetical protein